MSVEQNQLFGLAQGKDCASLESGACGVVWLVQLDGVTGEIIDSSYKARTIEGINGGLFIAMRRVMQVDTDGKHWVHAIVSYG